VQVLPRPLLRRLDPVQRFGLRLTLFAFALVLVAVPFSYLLFEVIREGPFTRFDESTANDLHRHVVGHPNVVRALDAVSLLGKPLLLGACVAVGAVFVYRHGRWRLALFLVFTAIGGGLVDSAVKIIVNRPRPVLESPLASAFGKSFPSGHAMSSTVTYGALLLVLLPALPRRGRPFAIAGTIALVASIGMSRLLLGVHYVSDVVAGYALGLAWVLGSAALFNIWRRERGAPPVDLTAGLEPEARRDLTTSA
jgi:undecaprenyl-diphosphatase